MRLSSAPVSARGRLAAAIAELRAAEAEKRPAATSSLGPRGIAPPAPGEDEALRDLLAAEDACERAKVARADAISSCRSSFAFGDVKLELAPPYVRQADHAYKQAQGELASAKAKYEEFEENQNLKRMDEQSNTDVIERLKRRVDAAVKAVIAEAPGIPSLLNELHRVRQREQELLNALSVIGSVSAEALPQFYDVRSKYNYRSADARFAGSPQLGLEWREAMRRLELDASVPLPGDKLQSDEAEAA